MKKLHPISVYCKLFSLSLFLSISFPITAHADDACESSGDYNFVCGMQNAEDFVLVPETKWIISSGMGPGASIYLINAQDKTWTDLYPAMAPRAQQNMQRYAACPGSPDPNNFISHGVNISPGADGHSTLYVVGHGGREAIEVFDVNANDDVPTLTWTGCIMTPDNMPANSVASLADGSLLVTIPLRAGIGINEALAGRVSGGVYGWSPGDSGFTQVEGTDLPYANGIEVAADGKEFYVASSGLFTVQAYSNSNPARLLRTSKVFSFVPDNLHMDDDGALVTAGLNLYDEVCGDVLQSIEFNLEAFAACPRPFTVLTIDPQTLNSEILASGPANENFSNITMALKVAGELWIGTFGGDRVAYRSLEALSLTGQSESQDAFFQQIRKLCDSRFSGQASFPEDPGDDWRGKNLVAHIETCSEDEIRIPFSVGEDHSRTWILSRVGGGLQLKHDHRHEDGTPDEVTLYGGTTLSAGNHLAQSFPADAYTADLIPDAATNEWFLSLSDDGSEMTYYLERHGQPRFRAVLYINTDE